MRKLFAVLILTSFGLFACTRVLAPDPVHKAFMERFKNATDVEWEHTENSWEAEFVVNGKHMEAVYDEGGQWLETDCDMQLKDLPALLRDSLELCYKDYKIEEVHSIETPDFNGYVIVVEKGEIEIELLANEKEIIKATEEVDADVEDDSDENEHHDADSDHDHDHDGDHDHDHDK